MNENEQCNEKYPFLITNQNESVKSCEDLNMYIFNNLCLSTCSGNKIVKYDGKYCECKYNYYINNSKLYCLNANEKCIEEFPYLENNECLKKCSDKLVIYNNKCIKECPEN